MKKVNNKGFMLLETLVVSAFVITILIYLYVQFVNLKNSYDKSLKYDSVSNIYSLKQVDSFINNNYGYGEFEEKIEKSQSNYIELYHNSCELEYFSNNNSYCNKLMTDLNLKTLIMVNNRLDDIKNDFKQHNPYSNGLLTYMKSIDPVLASKSYLLIAEFKDNTYSMLKLDDVNVIVIFDANGGTVKTKSKNVTPGQKYGTLPTPTREGYTFKGWNGKNLVNISNQNITFTNNNYKQSFPNPKYELKPNTAYTLSFNNKVNSTTQILNASIGYGADGVYEKDVCFGGRYSDDGKYEANFTTSDSFSTNSHYVAFRLVRMGIAGDADVDISNVMFEEGETATEYEPYYVTKDTKVVQNDNHTLKAIWEKNN